MDLIQSAEEIGIFCRLNMNIRKDIPIRSSEMGVLIYIYKQGEITTPIMISQFFKIKKPSVTSQVNSLIKQGFVEKIPSLTDKRSYYLKVTHKGTLLVNSTFEDYFKLVKVIKGKMGTEDFNQFIQYIKQANLILGELK